MRLLKAYTITALVSHQTANSAQEDGIKRWKRIEPNKTCNKLGKAAKTCGKDGYCCNANATECTDEMKMALQKRPKKALVSQCVIPVTERSKKEKNSIKKCLDGYKPSIYSSKHGKLGALCKNLADVVYKFIDRPNYQCSELKRIRKTYFNLVSMKNHCGKKQNKKKQKAQKKAKKAADRQKKRDQKEEDKNRERREDDLLDESEEELDESTGIVNNQEASNLDDNIAALDMEQSEADIDHDLAEVFRNQCTNYKNDSNISEEDKSECEEIENLINGVTGDTEEERERNKDRKWIVARIIRVRDGIQSWTNAYITGECSHRKGQLNTRIKRMGNKIKDVRTKYPTSPKKQAAMEKENKKAAKEKKEKALVRANRKKTKVNRIAEKQKRLAENAKKQAARAKQKAEREAKQAEKQAEKEALEAAQEAESENVETTTALLE